MPLTRGASVQQRMLEAIRRHFRVYGGSPSYNELAAECGVTRTAVWRILRDLIAAGQISVKPGPRGIILPDRCEMLSDTELELATIARGGCIVWPVPAASALVPAYAHMLTAGPNCSLPIDDLLAQIDAGDRGNDDGSLGKDESWLGEGCQAQA